MWPCWRPKLSPKTVIQFPPFLQKPFKAPLPVPLNMIFFITVLLHAVEKLNVMPVIPQLFEQVLINAALVLNLWTSIHLICCEFVKMHVITAQSNTQSARSHSGILQSYNLQNDRTF